MFKNYVKTALRNLWKNRGYGFLNISRQLSAIRHQPSAISRQLSAISHHTSKTGW